MRSFLIATLVTAAIGSSAVAVQAQTAPQAGSAVQMIDARRAQVVFTGFGSTQSLRKAALVSAAAMTMDQGGTWFRVDNEWVANQTDGETTVALEVKFGEGPTPGEANAFDAPAVAQASGAQLQASR